ncbi:helix-turn-helix domain-containing protein [Phenylobacterium sp.]|uniref:helix-turn-helix domain-containing protein n=1 Tax=Phenylobacterium sp. TaxID=1871053 RepID=UPI003BA98B89
MPLKTEHTADPVDVTVGTRIRFTRKMRGTSQQALAAAIGVTFQQVQKYERGANRVSASMLVRIADTLEVDISDLFGRGAARGAIDDQLADLLATTGALDMLSAYASLPSDSRTALVGLMRSLQNVG